jgi:NH3-dependent NAD+ synthetase
MSDRAKQLLNAIKDDWQAEGQILTDDLERRFEKLATLAELVVIDGGSDSTVKAYRDLVALELASSALQAEAQVRAAFQRTAIRAIRFVVAAVGAV